MHAPKIARPAEHEPAKPSPFAARQADGRWSDQPLQAKLVAARIDDPLENEADRAADLATGSSNAPVSPLGRIGPMRGATGGPSKAAVKPTAVPLRIQRQWSDAPLGPMGGATSTQTTPPSYGWNRDETTVGRIRRIPIEGLRVGNMTPDPNAAAAEAANARAIVLLPETIDLTQPVEVLLHLHGHNVGYRQRRTAGLHPTLKVGSVRDIDTDRIEQQLQASGRPMIGILPQGTTGSGFGGFDSNAYITDVFRILSGIGAFGKRSAPRIARVVLSGHSGAGAPIAAMLSEPGQPRLPASLGEVALFDSINGPGELTAVTNWVLARLAGDLAALTASGVTPAQQTAYLQTSLRFRAYYTNSSYAARHLTLHGSIEAWFARHATALGGRASPMYATLRDHYRVVAVGHSDHEVILGRDNKLQDALNLLPPVPSGAGAGAAAVGASGASGAAGGAVQQKADGPAGVDEAEPPQVAAALESPGRPLEADAKEYFEGRFRPGISAASGSTRTRRRPGPPRRCTPKPSRWGGTSCSATAGTTAPPCPAGNCSRTSWHMSSSRPGRRRPPAPCSVRPRPRRRRRSGPTRAVSTRSTSVSSRSSCRSG